MSDGHSPTLYTIGHSNHAIDRFVVLLKQHAIEALADVRSSPHARYATQFNAPDLKAAVEVAGIRYVSMGHEMGGRPTGAEFYDADGHVLYGRMATAPFFQHGLKRLLDGTARMRIAVMCSEENPVDCHRRLLISRVAAQRGIDALHIRGDGRVETEQEVAAHEAAQYPERVQMSLFPREEETWRSTRSVSPDARRPTSSAPSGTKTSDDW